MGGGLCRPSDVFSASLPLAVATALPLHRSFLHDALLTPNLDPWQASDVQSFLSPALAASLALPQEQRKQQAFAQSLFARYHHSATPALSHAQLGALVHDYLAATVEQVPQLVSAVMADSQRQLLTLIAHHRSATPLTRDERRHIDARTRQAEAHTNQLLAAWLHSLRQREAQLTHELWQRLSEKGKGAGGVTEAVFVEWWQAVSDEVMASKQFALRLPSPWDGDYDAAAEDGADETEERKKGDAGAHGRGSVEDSITVVETINPEESLRMRHGSVSDLRPGEPPNE